MRREVVKVRFEVEPGSRCLWDVAQEIAEWLENVGLPPCARKCSVRFRTTEGGTGKSPHIRTNVIHVV